MASTIRDLHNNVKTASKKQNKTMTNLVNKYQKKYYTLELMTKSTSQQEIYKSRIDFQKNYTKLELNHSLSKISRDEIHLNSNYP